MEVINIDKLCGIEIESSKDIEDYTNLRFTFDIARHIMDSAGVNTIMNVLLASCMDNDTVNEDMLRDLADAIHTEVGIRLDSYHEIYGIENISGGEEFHDLALKIHAQYIQIVKCTNQYSGNTHMSMSSVNMANVLSGFHKGKISPANKYEDVMNIDELLKWFYSKIIKCAELNDIPSFNSDDVDFYISYILIGIIIITLSDLNVLLLKCLDIIL